MAFHDSNDGGETEAGPLPDFFGREKWIENLVHRLGRHAGAAVRDTQHDVRPELRAGIHPRDLIVHDDVLRADGERAARGHGVARVDAEIQQDLVELRGVAVHGPQIGRKRGLDVDVSREGLRHDFGEFVHEMLRLNEDPLAFHAAREGEHLLHDASAALAAALDDVEHLLGVGILATLSGK